MLLSEAKEILKKNGYICEAGKAKTDDLNLHADNSKTERKDVMKKILDYLKKVYGIVSIGSNSDKDVMRKSFKNGCYIRVTKMQPPYSRKNAKQEFMIAAEPNIHVIDDADIWHGSKLKGLTAKDVADSFVEWYKLMQIANNQELKKYWHILRSAPDEYLIWDEHTEYAGLKKPLPRIAEPTKPKYTNLRRYVQALYDAITARGINPEIAMDYCNDLDYAFMQNHQDIESIADEVALEYDEA